MKKTLLLLVAMAGICFTIAGVHGFQTGRLTTVITAHGNERGLSVTHAEIGQINLVNGDQVIIGRAEALTQGSTKIQSISEFDPSVNTDPVTGAVEQSSSVEEFDKPGTYQRIFAICESAWDFSRFIWSQIGSDAEVEYWNDYLGGSELIGKDQIQGTGSFLRNQNPAVAATFYNDRSASSGRGLLPDMYFQYNMQGPSNYLRSPLFTAAYDTNQMNSEIGKPGNLRVVVKLKAGKIGVGITDISVKRMGGPLNQGIGVFTKQIRTVESGKPFSPDVCPNNCPQQPTPTPAVCIPTPTPTATPTPTPTPAPTPVPGSTCGPTICFRHSSYWLLQRNFPGTVLIGGANFNNPTSNPQSIKNALEGGSTDLQKLNQQFVAGQLSVNAVGGEGTPNVVSAYKTSLQCYNAEFPPQLLSNGQTVTMETSLGELVTHTWWAIKNKSEEDYAKLALVWKAINEPRVALAYCPN